MKYNTIFFDLDGTLTNSQKGITNSVAYSLAKFGINVEDKTTLNYFIGPPLYESFMKGFGFSFDEATLAVKYYRENYEVRGIFENEVYDGLMEMLEDLTKMGKKLYIATSKPEKYAKIIASHFGLDKYLSGVYGSTMTEKRTNKAEVIEYALENIDDKHVLMIGDKSHDVIGAHKNSLECVGVLYGFGDFEELENASADYIVKDVKELHKLLKTI